MQEHVPLVNTDHAEFAQNAPDADHAKHHYHDIQKDKESWKIIRRQLFYNPLRLLYLREDLYRLVDE